MVSNLQFKRKCTKCARWKLSTHIHTLSACQYVNTSRLTGVMMCAVQRLYLSSLPMFTRIGTCESVASVKHSFSSLLFIIGRPHLPIALALPAFEQHTLSNTLLELRSFKGCDFSLDGLLTHVGDFLPIIDTGDLNCTGQHSHYTYLKKIFYIFFS